MIELKVEDYCQSCPDFKPKVHSNYGGDIGHFVIRCEYANRCRLFVERLEKHVEKQAAVQEPRCWNELRRAKKTVRSFL